MKKKKSLIYILMFYLFFTFLFYPITSTFIQSLTETSGIIGLGNYKQLLNSATDQKALVNTIVVGLATVISCSIVGTFLAFRMEYFSMGRNWKRINRSILLLPFLLPGVIIVLANMQLFGDVGMINLGLKKVFGLKDLPFVLSGFWGILYIHIFTQYIYFYLNTSISLRYLDQRQIESAKSLGAGPLKVFTDVIFPHIKPALITSAIMTFMSGIGSFSAPYLVGKGYRVLSTQILSYKVNNHMQIASAQVIVLLLLSLGMVILQQYYEKDSFIDSKSKNIVTRTRPIPKKLKIPTECLFSLIVIAIFLPVVSIILLSFADTSSWMTRIFPNKFGFQNYIAVFSNARILKPIENSLLMSILAATGAAILGGITAYLILDKKNLAGKFLGTLSLLPMAIPASTLGITMIVAFNKKQLLLGNNSLVGTFWILPIAYLITSLTMVTRSSHTAFMNYNKEYTWASRGLGASQLQTLRLVFIPLVKNGILSGFILCFMRSLGEYTISALLYGVHNRPISIAMISALQDYDIGISMAYGGIIIALGIIFLLIIEMKGWLEI